MAPAGISGSPASARFLPSVPVIAALWLLLAPGCCLLMSHQGAAPPFRNLRLKPNELRLSWERGITPGLRAACQKDGRSTVFETPGSNYCTFPSLSACHVTNLTVFLLDDPEVAAWTLHIPPDPNRAAAAVDLRCQVHDVVRMTCRWGRGPGAPPDVQYRMLYRSARLGLDRDRECPRYDVTDALGARLGCQLDNVTGLPVLLAVTVTGSSASTEVSCSDAMVDLPLMEVLAPPTLTAICNGSAEALVHWDMQSLFNGGFKFELEIRRSSRLAPEVQKTSESHHRVPNPGSASFRLRAQANDVTVPVSAWSRAVALDCRPWRGPGMALTGGLAALGAGLVVLVTVLLLCRRPLKVKLFPPIPRVADPMGTGPGELVPWAAAPEDILVTHVTEA